MFIYNFSDQCILAKGHILIFFILAIFTFYSKCLNHSLCFCFCLCFGGTAVVMPIQSHYINEWKKTQILREAQHLHPNYIYLYHIFVLIKAHCNHSEFHLCTSTFYRPLLLSLEPAMLLSPAVLFVYTLYTCSIWLKILCSWFWYGELYT